MVLTIFPLVANQAIIAQSSPRDTPERESAILQDAISLVEIYYKLKRLSGDRDARSELRPYLEQLNGILDRTIAFKESFTPAKRAELEKQLSVLKKEIVNFAEIPPAKMKSHVPKLADAIWNLVQILIEWHLKLSEGGVKQLWTIFTNKLMLDWESVRL